MNTPPPTPKAVAGDHRCGQCGAELNATGVCTHCLFLMLDDEVDMGRGKFLLPGLEGLEELARGGMGVVYKARETATGRVVAVKMPGTRMWEDEDAMRRFAQEVRSAALLDHPHVLPVYEVGRKDGAPFFTMKYASGGSLAEQAKAHRERVPDATSYRWMAETLAKVADAVQFAHEHGVLHRDLKPGNILFDEAGEPYVADFGLAKWLEGNAMGEPQNLTNTITSLGTPHYLAPEIASGKAGTASTTTDVYALGAILYELLCGRPPHEGGSITLLLRNVADTRPSPPSAVAERTLPKDLEAVCLKAMESEAADRYLSAGDFAADLRRFLAGEGVRARPLPAAQQLWRWSRRHPAISILAVTLVLVLAASAVIQMRSARSLATALTTAESSLRDSLIAQSRLVRKSHRLGQRYEALELVRKAAEGKEGDAIKLRSEAAAALATPDLRRAGEAFRFKPTSHRGQSAAVTPDFRHVLSRSLEGEVALRNLDTGAIVWRPTSTRSTSPEGFALSNTARYAALTFPDLWLEVWDTTENKLLLSTQLLPVGSQSAYFAAARPFFLHPTLPLVMGVDANGTVWIRHLDSGTQETFQEDRKNTTAVHIAPDGKSAVIAGGSAVEALSLDERKRQWRFSMRDAGAATAWHEGCMVVADRSTREVLTIKGNRDGSTTFRGHDLPVVALQLAPEGWRTFSLGFDGLLCVWDKRDGKLLWQLQSGPSFMQLHESGSSLLCEDRPGYAVKWECAPERVFREFTSELNSGGSAVIELKVSGDGRLVATTSNAFAQVWDTRERRMIERWRTDGDKPGTTVAFSSDDTAVFGSRQSGAGIFRRNVTWKGNKARFGEPERVPGSEGLCISHVSADNKSWIVYDTQPRLWEPGSGQPPRPLASGELKRGHEVSPLLHYVSSSGYGQGSHAVLDVKSGAPCGKFEIERSANCDFSPGEHWMVLSEASQYRFIDPKSWKETAVWHCDFDGSVVGVVAVSRDGKLAALEQKNDVIDIITLPECELLVSLEPPVSTSARVMAFSPDGGSLYILSAAHRLFEWDLKALREELGKLGLAW